MNLPEVLNNLIKPELLVLVPVLYYVGHCLKRWEAFKDEMIPVAVGGIAIRAGSNLYPWSRPDQNAARVL